MHFCEKRLVFIKKNSCLYLVQYSQKKFLSLFGTIFSKKFPVFIWYNILTKIPVFIWYNILKKNSCLYLVQYSQKNLFVLKILVLFLS